MPVTRQVIKESFKEEPLPKERMLFFMERCYLIEELVNLHSWARNGQPPLVQKEVFQSVFASSEPIRQYYGENIAIYFEWLNYYLKWLIVPAAFSLIIYLYSLAHDIPVKDNYSYSVYSFVVSIWATLFAKFWTRKSNELMVEWENFANNSIENKRKEFKGVVKFNEVTDVPEVVFPTSKRLWRYVYSAVLGIPFLILASIVMMAGLNCLGYVDKEEIFYVGFLARMADEGGIF